MADQQIQLDDNLHWYKDAIIYELHIKAFKDSNGDGIGDLQGLLNKLDYLEDLGITAIWLLPFYPSPLRDDGYDIADYYSINPSYGDVKQFKKFLKEAHKRNLKVITELVINHTSDQHPWFQRARNAPKSSPERNFYVWTDDPHDYKDARIIFQDYEVSNWTWDPVAGQYYWHRFFHHQPDLNYDNPAVQQEVFKILDYWMKMGVDGFRLDAVPYLFQREGTNCENLPETHDFLKKLRKHVDDNFQNKLLLAEANMWPEDSASYFGNGDECHMNYHFPVMPRMFMALQMEDRYPIMDIFDQTPAIPETCQWAIFLRNHDELTLEMVTDEERDYMYKVYAKDPKAKINVGIRHRLAPLLDNNRKKIELINYLLFSLPGTPVIYYGDEIGMGDNYYLGDRDGVRTPMQWSPDRNAGFSSANPQKLYLPTILDPEYHYEAVNVETQQHNTSSLLWWMKRVINMRKKHKAFSRGELQFIYTENAKVLAFTRTYEEETILVVVNLSRFAQPSELHLEHLKGYIPVEIFSRNQFPVISEDGPYVFTLGPHAYHWFLLQKEHEFVDKEEKLPHMVLEQWKDMEKKKVVERLEQQILPKYLQKVRWFGGKGRTIQGISIGNKIPLETESDTYYILFLEVNYTSGLPEIYQLPVGFELDTPEKETEHYPQAHVARARLAKEEGIIFDAMFSADLQKAIFKWMAAGEVISRASGEIQFSGKNQLKKHLKCQGEVKSRVLSAEQSNTSIVYDSHFFLKIYRKLDHVINPDLEVSRFLSEKAHFSNIPEYMGAISLNEGKDSMILGMMLALVPNQGDAWFYMQDALKNYYEKILSQTIPLTQVKIEGSLKEPVSYEDSPAQMEELIGGVVAEQTRLLGVRTAEMHKALASAVNNSDFKPEPFSLHYQRSLYSSLQSLVREVFQNLNKNLKKLPETLQDPAGEILGRKNEVLKILQKVYKRKFEAIKTRTHGDFHLGQVLFTGKDFVMLDFEGEPARSYSERRLKRSPLRDVAGMIRSFHYAAFGGIFLNNHIREEDIAGLLPWADLWYHYITNYYLNAYLENVKDTRFIPDNKEDLEVLLQTFLLEKAIYELNYELNNRPDWVKIPLWGIKSILKYNEEIAQV